MSTNQNNIGQKMNIYRLQFACRCPANDKQIIYTLEIQSDKMIYVEHIVVEVGRNESDYHEAIADRLHVTFGGQQLMTATHHGVNIETRRGFA